MKKRKKMLKTRNNTASVESIKTDYLSGMSLRQIGKKYDRNASSIRSRLIYYGFKDFRHKLTDEQKLKKSLSNKGRKHSKEACEKMSMSKVGSKNPNWKGGITSERVKIWRSKEYKE